MADCLSHPLVVMSAEGVSQSVHVPSLCFPQAHRQCELGTMNINYPQLSSFIPKMVNMIVNSAVTLLKFAKPQNLSPYAKFMQHFPLLIVKISDKVHTTKSIESSLSQAKRNLVFQPRDNKSAISLIKG